MRRKRLISVLMAILVLIMSVTVVMAEEQEEVATSMGIEVTCTLDCDFYWNANDRATATSSWAGKTGHRVCVIVYSCANAIADYKMHDVAMEYSKATVKASKASVWKFKSVHATYDINAEKASMVCTLTDW